MTHIVKVPVCPNEDCKSRVMVLCRRDRRGALPPYYYLKCHDCGTETKPDFLRDALASVEWVPMDAEG